MKEGMQLISPNRRYAAMIRPDDANFCVYVDISNFRNFLKYIRFSENPFKILRIFLLWNGEV